MDDPTPTPTPAHPATRGEEEDPLAGTLELFVPSPDDVLPGGRVRATLTLTGTQDALPIELYASTAARSHGYTARLSTGQGGIRRTARTGVPACPRAASSSTAGS